MIRIRFTVSAGRARLRLEITPGTPGTRRIGCPRANSAAPGAGTRGVR